MERSYFRVNKEKQTKNFGWVKGFKIKLQANLDFDFHLDLEQSLAEELEEICFQEKLLWIHKSSSNAICIGDHNTSFYHTKALIERIRNIITKLMDPDGNWLSSEEDLSDLANRYFCDLYSLQPHDF